MLDSAAESFVIRAQRLKFRSKAHELIEAAQRLKVCFIGETIIDEYIYIAPLSKPPKEYTLAVLKRDVEQFAGGVVAAANHAAAICGSVSVVTYLGEDSRDVVFLENRCRPNIQLYGYPRHGCPTIRKTRYIDRDFNRKLFEVYDMNDELLSPFAEAPILKHAIASMQAADFTVVADFGHGLVTPAIRAAIEREAKWLAVNAQSNSANQGFNLIQKYDRADYVCIDEPEARLALACKHEALRDIIGALVPDHRKLIVTTGRHGCLTYEQGHAIREVPPFADKIIDTMGAGDAFLAVTAPLLYLGAELELAAFIGNIVGALKVASMGHRRPVTKEMILQRIDEILP